MIDVTLRYLDYEIMKTQLGQLGITVNKAEDGQTLSINKEFGLVNSSPLDTQTGKVFTLRMSDEDAAKLDDYLDPPDFVCDWRSDEGYEKEGSVVQFDQPVYSIDSVDVDDNPVTITQGAGRIFT